MGVVLGGLVLLGVMGARWDGGDGVAFASTVVLVRPPTPSAMAAEATVRVRGELVAAGFDVQVIDAPAGEDIRTALEEAATGPEVEAVVAILGDERKPEAKKNSAKDSAELWVIDRVTGKTVVRRVDTDPNSARAAEMLSIRALELLRASFLEVALGGPPRTPKVAPPPPPPVEVSRWTREALQEADRNELNWAVEAGAYVRGSLDGIPASVVPLLRLERRLGTFFMLRLTAAGLGSPARVYGDSGYADVDHRIGLLELVLRFRSGKGIQPFLSVGGGVLSVTVAGYPSPTAKVYDPSTAPSRSATANVGAGLRFPIQRRFEVAIEVQAEVAGPYPTVSIAKQEVAREGIPTLVGSLTLAAWM